MKTAIFGGSFNPVHIGHLLIAEEILVQTDCDSVLFVPAYNPPHKEIPDPGPELRLAMLEASIADNPRFRSSDCEIRRTGVSYTIDTIRHLVGAGIVEPKPFLVIGDDLVEGFCEWREFDAVAHEASLLIVHRRFEKCLPMSFPHRYIDNAIFPVSSSIVRDRIAAGTAWRYLVPDAARRLVEDHGLYGLRKS
ncbi:MAG TPA: nicotinate (nicotinamide) nucleotide adenylyltransferase [Spirochaetaceae bacterium]|nr:nicotinate (nicotinamide) nucleotide adenylyltransferase [Spirochaetaceae bacterium]